MRRRTRGGRNIPTLTRRVTRRKQSANLARKANEQAKQVIQESEKLQRQITQLANNQQNKMEKMMYDLIKVSKEEKGKKTLTIDDYLVGFTIRLRTILEYPYEYLSGQQNFINLRKDLIHQYSKLANQLSTNSYDALYLSTKTPLSNHPNQIDNNEANEEMKRILTRTAQNGSVRPVYTPPNELLARMNLAIQIAHAMEYITYIYVMKTTEKRNPFSLRVLSILEKKKITLPSDLRAMQSTSNNIESNRIRQLIDVDLVQNGREIKKGGIHYIFHWLLDATYTAWNIAIDAVKEYKKLSPNHFFTNSTLFEVYCYSSQYNLYFRLPILLLFNLKGKVLSDIGVIRFFKDTLLEWKKEEEKYNPDPASFLTFYLKKQKRLQFIEWLKENKLEQDPRVNSYSVLFTDYDKDIRETEEWLRSHDPNKTQGFVQSEVARIEQSAPKPSTAPISVKPSPMKVAARPSTGLTLAAYKPRLAQEQQAAIAAAQAAKSSTGFPPKK